MEKKTPLYETHLALGGKIVPFAGYLLPVQYGAGVIGEHMAVRKQCGLFDVSHMGEFVLEGEGAEAFLNRVLTNDFGGMEDGQARYSPMCNEQGGVVDDLIVYREKGGRYMIVVNASNREKDFAFMSRYLGEEEKLTDISDRGAQLALQGPAAEKVLRKLAAEEQIPEKYYHACFDGQIEEIPCVISRTGYTGEDGFELYCQAQDAPRLWELVMKAGEEEGILPCGLGARDTLRLEAGMPLYGHELSDEISPREAGLGIFVKFKTKGDFVGRKAMEEAGAPTRKRVGLKVTGRGIIREEAPIYAQGKQIGVSTSGTHCPYLGYPAAMALIEKEYAEPGTRLTALVRGREVEAEVVKLPFYKRV